jgi:hypothetical protein
LRTAEERRLAAGLNAEMPGARSYAAGQRMGRHLRLRNPSSSKIEDEDKNDDEDDSITVVLVML